MRINFKPYPGASYFTVREHEMKFAGNAVTPKILTEVESGIRNLFHIPTDFKLSVLPVGLKTQLPAIFNEVILLDDPATGKRREDNLAGTTRANALLDLSYSFPYIPQQKGDFHHYVVDPNASLGVPSESMYIFSRIDLPEQLQGINMNPDENAKELFVLNGVLKDLAEKGLEQCLREANYKAAVLYQLIESQQQLLPVVGKTERSKTCILTSCSWQFRARMEKLGYEFTVSRAGKNEHIVIANYLTHSKESIEMLADRIEEL